MKVKIRWSLTLNFLIASNVYRGVKRIDLLPLITLAPQMTALVVLDILMVKNLSTAGM